MHVAFDVDGVLANFSHGFSQVLHDLFGTPVVAGDFDVKSWNWADWMDGLTHEQERAAWEEVNRRPSFWLDLDPFVDAQVVNRINRLGNDHQVSFLTNRRMTERPDTRLWLHTAGFRKYENVYTVMKQHGKGRSAHWLGANVAIDDNGPNVLDYLDNNVFACLLRRPYNEGFAELVKARQGRIVDTVEEFVDLLHVLAVRQDEVFDDSSNMIVYRRD